MKKDQHWFVDVKPTAITRGMTVPAHWKGWLFLICDIAWCAGFARLAYVYAEAGKSQEAFVCGFAAALGGLVGFLTVSARSKRL